MKILFLVGNYYLHAEPYFHLAGEMRGAGIETDLYFFGDRKAGKQDVEDIRMKEKYDVLDLPVGDIVVTRKIRDLLPLPFQLMANRLRLKRFLKKEKPSLIVSSGDITDLIGRIFLDLCSELKIKVLIVPMVIPGPTVVNPDLNKGIPLAFAARWILGLMGLEKVIFTRGWVLGSYHEEALIFAPDGATARMLTNNGIDPHRILITGSLGLDRLHEYKELSETEVARRLPRIKEFLGAGRLVVLVTEVIQQIYSDGFVEKSYGALAKTLNALGPDVRVVIKLHPREPGESRRRLERIFSGDRYLVVEQADLLALFRMADLVIGHFSAVLKDAALLGRPVLSVRLPEETNSPIIFDDTNPKTHIFSTSEMAEKVTAILEDDGFRGDNLETIEAWRAAAEIPMDGGCGRRIADLAATLAKAEMNRY